MELGVSKEMQWVGSFDFPTKILTYCQFSGHYQGGASLPWSGPGQI
jgi:hypothetical protein